MLIVHKKRAEYQPIINTAEKVEKSIMRLNEFAKETPTGRLPIAAFSGGKDSLVAYMMCIETGIKFKAIYSPTSVDPAELRNFKKINVNMATKYDFNAPNIVKLRDRSKIHKMLNRYARRKLKENIKSEVEQ